MAPDELPDGVGAVGTQDGGAIWGGHAGEVIGAVVVEGEVLQQATMGFHQTVGVVVEETPVGGVSALLSDGIDGVWGALVGIAPGLVGMVDGSQTPVLAVFIGRKQDLTTMYPDGQRPSNSRAAGESSSKFSPSLSANAVITSPQQSDEVSGMSVIVNNSRLPSGYSRSTFSVRDALSTTTMWEKLSFMC